MLYYGVIKIQLSHCMNHRIYTTSAFLLVLSEMAFSINCSRFSNMVLSRDLTIDTNLCSEDTSFESVDICPCGGFRFKQDSPQWNTPHPLPYPCKNSKTVVPPKKIDWINAELLFSHYFSPLVVHQIKNIVTLMVGCPLTLSARGPSLDVRVWFWPLKTTSAAERANYDIYDDFELKKPFGLHGLY